MLGCTNKISFSGPRRKLAYIIGSNWQLTFVGLCAVASLTRPNHRCRSGTESCHFPNLEIRAERATTIGGPNVSAVFPGLCLWPNL